MASGWAGCGVNDDEIAVRKLDLEAIGYMAILNVRTCVRYHRGSDLVSGKLRRVVEGIDEIIEPDAADINVQRRSTDRCVP